VGREEDREDVDEMVQYFRQTGTVSYSDLFPGITHSYYIFMNLLISYSELVLLTNSSKVQVSK
jgi:hypothetical protein